MSPSLTEMESEIYRGLILAVMAKDRDFSVNTQILRIALLDLHGFNLSRDRLRGELAWLADQGLITVRDGQGITQIAKITARGLDVAEGGASMPGVKYPEPGLGV